MLFFQVDDEPFPEFNFVKECCEVGGAGIEWNINTIQVQLLVFLLPISCHFYIYNPSAWYTCFRLAFVKEIVETTRTVLVVKCAMKRSSGMTR